MRSRREKTVTFIISVLGITAFFVTSFFAIVWANGLTFDANSRNFEQTAIVAIDAKFTSVTVTLNGRIIGNQTPLQERNLPAGRYELVIKKNGFRDYHKTFQLAVGEAGLVPSETELLASDPVTEKDRTDLTYIERDPIETGLSLSAGELLDQGKLVSRFSTNPVLVRRFNKGYVYQMNADLRWYLPENNSDILLYKLPDNTPAKVNLNDSNWQLTIFAGASATVIHLIEPSAASVNQNQQ